MPITIAPNKLYAKKQDGSGYLPANVVTGETTEEQCAAVEAKGTTEVARIQTKAEEVTAQLANAAEVENMFAGAFNSSTAYTAGQYVIQTITSGGSSVNKLFRFTSDHAAGAWTGTDAVEVKICNDVADLKSALAPNTQVRTPTYDDDKAISISTSVPLQDGEYKTVGTAANICGFWLDCVEGDEFVITGSIGNLVPWAFIGDFTSSDTSVDVITSGAKNSTFSKRTITAPTGAKHVIIQLLSSSSPVVVSIENSFNKKFTDNENLVFDTVGRARVNIPVTWAQGYITPDGSTTDPRSSNTRCASNGFIVEKQFDDIRSIEIDIPNGLAWRVTFWNSEAVGTGTLIATDSNTNWQSGYYSCAIPSNAVYAAISVKKSNDGNIAPSELSGAKAYLLYGTYLGNAFQGKRISILGDSISTYAGENASTYSDGHLIADGTYTYTGNHCRYPTDYMSNVNSAYWKKLIDELGMVLGINDSWAGSRVSWNGSATGSDDNSNVCISSQTRINHLGENGTPDYILVNAGTNDIGARSHRPPVGTFNTENPVNYTDQQIADMSDPSKSAFCVGTFAGAYRTMLIRLQKKYPLARIVVMLPNYTTTYYNPTEADEYLEIIKEACDYFGIPWVDMRTTGVTMYNTATYLGDGIHPNVAGMSALANKMLKFFEYSL